MTAIPSIDKEGRQRISWGGVAYLASFLGSDHCPPELVHIAIAPVLSCTECGDGPYSAVDLYSLSLVPGECCECTELLVHPGNQIKSDAGAEAHPA